RSPIRRTYGSCFRVALENLRSASLEESWRMVPCVRAFPIHGPLLAGLALRRRAVIVICRFARLIQAVSTATPLPLRSISSDRRKQGAIAMRTTRFVIAVLLSLPAPSVAQEWDLYMNTEDGFQVSFPGQPQVADSWWRTEQGYVLPARIYSAARG